ncbi:helicase associated domain-containing protein [Streptomyces atroolivaceus]|uniref:Helicase associated domain-containing protein n=1 Tax=Streptomyces atroolivaceus TaxID=66869 RepID=A0ABV9VFC8_STRAZ|nr:helicase associated domain-containing protein [Streptomyces atroolivaceus]
MRSITAVHGSLASPKNAVMDGVAVGQWLANRHKADGLGKDQERATQRRAALEAIAPDGARSGPSSDSATTPPHAPCSPRNEG